MTDQQPTIESLMARLDRQAKAISDLRARVSKLEGRDAEPVKADRTVTFLGTVGVYVPNPACVSCGKKKSPMDRFAACRDCNRNRNAALQKRLPPKAYDACGNCGKTLNKSRQPFCGLCAKSYREWRDKNITG